MRERLAPGGRLVFTYVPSGSLYGLVGNGYRFIKRRLAPETAFISRTYALKEVRAALGRSGCELERYFGVGLLCVNAQTRLVGGNPLLRALDALVRFEARLCPYYEHRLWARCGAHVVGFARARESDGAHS